MNKSKLSQFSYLGVLIILIPFFKPRYLSNISFINTFYNLFLYAMMGAMLLRVFINYKFIKFNKFERNYILLSALYFVSIILALLYNNLGIYVNFLYYSKIIVLILYTFFMMKNHEKNFLLGICGLLNILVLFQTVTVVLFPKGMYFDQTGNPGYFWNTDNHCITLLLTSILLNYIVCVCVKHKNSPINIAMIFISVALTFYVWSATSIMGMALFILLFIFRNKLPSKIYNPFFCLLIFVALNVLIVFFRIQNLFSWIIVDVLGKDITFTGRTRIWDIAINLIKKKALFGYGETDIIYIEHTWGSYYKLMAHNHFLDIMILGGVMSLICYILYLVYNAYILKKYANYQLTKVFVSYLYAILIMTITEKITPIEPVFLAFSLFLFVPKFESMKLDKVNN